MKIQVDTQCFGFKLIYFKVIKLSNRLYYVII